MDIEHATVALRQRSPSEALDLGIVVACTWWPTLLTSLILVAGPIALLVNALCVEMPWLAMLILWWLKPLFERLPLLIISRRFFGERLGPADAVRAIDRSLLAGLSGQLTWRRLSPLRAYLSPVEGLEGLWGPARRARANLIARAQAGTAFAATSLFWLAELAVFFAVFVLLALIAPFDTPFDQWFSDFWAGESGWHLTLVNVVYLLAMVVLMPFYVGSGFALYINRRVDLEAWDIDLDFKRLTRRLKRAGVLVTTALSLLLSLTGGQVWAAPQDPNLDEVRQAAAEVASDEAFGGEKLELVWVPIKQPKRPDRENLDMPELPSFGFGSLFVWVIGIAGAVTLFFLIRAIWRGRRERKKGEKITHHPPETLFGLDIRPQSLPKDIIGAVREAWQKGAPELALSLLYRAALARLTSDNNVVIPKSATEGECIDLVKAHVSKTMAGDFAALTRAWVHTAYGHRPPDEPTFVVLLNHWGQHLGEAR